MPSWSTNGWMRLARNGQRAADPLAAPALAMALAVLGITLGWRGGDLPASLYRVGLFQKAGLTLWDSQWYGGHWTLGYSVIFPPIAGILGVSFTTVACTGLASLAFDRIVTRHFGATARIGSLFFAAGTLVQASVGQLPFLMGEALALAACWAASRRRWWVAIPLGATASLASPLAGLFLGLGIGAWILGTWPRRPVALVAMGAAVAAPAGLMMLLFPGQGAMPYPGRDFFIEVVAGLVLWRLIPRREQVLRRAALVYVLVIAAAFLVPSPLGGNIGRLGDCVAIPLAGCVLWPHRRRVLALLFVPLTLWQWTPAWAAITENAKDPSTYPSYYTGLNAFLAAHAVPTARVEVVPTKLHWETVYVAPTTELARGWERQLDTANNPIFYDTDSGALTATAYLAWLHNSGARYVALPDASLDYAASAEGALVETGVPGLLPVWSDAHWRVFEVPQATGLVDGAATLTKLDGSETQLNVTAAGAVTLRVRYNSRWRVVVGQACLSADPNGWTRIDAFQPGTIKLQLRLLPDPAQQVCTGAR